MHPFALITILMILCYLARLVYLQFKHTARRKQSIVRAQADWLQAEQKRQEAKDQLFGQISGIYGKQATELVAQKKIWMGMPQHLLPLSFGQPDNAKESLYKDNQTQKLYFGQYINRLGNAKYTLEVIIENGVVAGWKDL